MPENISSCSDSVICELSSGNKFVLKRNTTLSKDLFYSLFCNNPKDLFKLFNNFQSASFKRLSFKQRRQGLLD